MWFGTEDGLNRYDGYAVTVYKHASEDPTSLGSNWIQVLFEDDNGTLWIGMRDGLDQFNPATETFIHYRNNPDDPSSLSDNDITAIFQDQSGLVWIGTSHGGLNQFNQEKNNFTRYQHDPSKPNSLSSDSISAIYEDYVGVLWIGTSDGGLNRFDLAENSWLNFLNDPRNPNSLSHNNVSTISADLSGALWIGTDGGGLNKLALNDTEGIIQEDVRFRHYQHNSNDPSSLSSNDIAIIYHDRDGVLWIGTRSSGISILNSETETFTHFQNIPGDPHSLSDNWIMSIFQDKEGVFWFGGVGSGVNKLSLGWKKFSLYRNNPNNPNSLSNNMVRAFTQDNDNIIWIGTMFGGLNRFDRETGDWQHYRNVPADPKSLSNDFVSAIFKDSSAVLWIGTESGLDRFNSETESFTHYQANPNGPASSPENSVRAIYEFAEGQLWIGTKDGLFKFYSDDNHWRKFDHFGHDDSHNLDSAWIFSFLEDQNGHLWITTAGDGIYSIDPETEIVTHYHNDPADPSSVSNNFVVAGFQDREGLFWFSTVEGLNRFDPTTETFVHYRSKDGLPNETVYCVLEDVNAHLWVSTNMGISMFNPQSETFHNFDVDDGLQSNEFNGSACYLGDDGEMFFGGINGFNTFLPEQMVDNSAIPSVVFTSLVVDGEQIHLADRADVSIKWPANAFEFEYAALSFAQPEENQYAYYLDGFEDTWNDVGTRRFGSYTNLPGGTYTLRVKGSNNDGIWNETGTTLNIKVVPPFLATRWFQGIVILALVGGAYVIYRLRVRNHEARERDLESQVEQRTAELIKTQEILQHSEMEKAIATERNRLARELHDSVTQSLYSLTLFSEAARHLADEQGLKSIEQQIKQIGVISLQALKEMRLLVYELQPPELERDGLVRALRKRLEAVEGRAGVEAQVDVEDFIKLPGRVEQEFYRIAQEALNNALKHAAASAVIVVLRQKNGRNEMEIIDDGVGFDPGTQRDSAGMGLVSIRERAEQLGGTVMVESQPGEGTRIKVSIAGIEETLQRGDINE